jgi:multidrug efflux system membrane fusion protein
MTNQNNPFGSSAEQARRKFDEARHRFGSAFSSSGQDSWAARHIPGGPKTLWILLIVVLVVLFVWWLLPGKSKNAQRGMGGAQPVGVAVAQKAPIDVTLNALGTVTPLATVSVRPQVSGTIIRFSFKEGQMVKAGDVLAEIDPRTFQAALTEAQGTLAKDMALLTNAKQELARQQSLWAAKATSKSTLDADAAAVKQYQGTVTADQANVKSAEVNLGYTRVTSPVNGRAGIRGVDVGNYVSTGQSTAIVTVTQLTPISVLFTVPEDEIHGVLDRFNAGEEMRVDAYDRAQANKLATGRLSAVDSYVDTSTGTVKLRAMFSNDEGELFPNQFVNVRLLVKTLPDQVVIPAAAVQRGASGTFVFVVTAEHTVSMRAVTLGVQQADKVAVTKGLNPGETVVTDGGDRLRDGSEVTVPSGQQVKDVAAPSGAGAPSGLSEKERAERRAKMVAACGSDIKKYCADAKGREMMMCMREHRDDLSDTCKNEMKKMRRSSGAGGAPGGGPGGPPPGGP